MRTLAGLLVCALLAASCGGSPRNPAAATPNASIPGGSAVASEYLQQLLSLMQNNSINRLQINWTDFKDRVTQRAQGAQTIPDLYPAISFALGLINDHHSFFVTPGGQGVGNPSGRACPAPVVADAMVPPDIGYVRITEWSSADAVANIAFADGIQRQIRAADRADLAGWVVDVRGNGGGNMWPMIAGVGPVLGEGLLGYFVPPAGLDQTWSYADGRASIDGSTLGRTSTTYTILRGAPRVALLTDGRVASSGEAVVVAFRGRPNTRSFGTPTCGLSTANGSFSLSDGGTLFLCVSTLADRTHTRYGDVIVPDETIAGADAAVSRAIAWLRGS